MRSRCIICKRKRGTKGVSFHRFPKDEKQLYLWLLHINKENCPPLSSVICSKHFAAECLESTVNGFRLKKGSIPTIFTEQSHSLVKLEPLSDNTLIESHGSPIEEIVDSKMHTLEAVGSSSMDASHYTAAEPLIEPHCSYMEEIVDSKTHILEAVGSSSMDASHYTAAEPLNEPHSSYMEEVAEASNMDAISRTQLWQQVQHDHQYTFTAKSYKRKLEHMQQRVRKLRNDKRILGQKVKRMQRRITSLKEVVTKLQELNLVSHEYF